MLPGVCLTSISHRDYFQIETSPDQKRSHRIRYHKDFSFGCVPNSDSGTCYLNMFPWQLATTVSCYLLTVLGSPANLRGIPHKEKVGLYNSYGKHVFIIQVVYVTLISSVIKPMVMFRSMYAVTLLVSFHSFEIKHGLTVITVIILLYHNIIYYYYFRYCHVIFLYLA